nr:hypothetical protein [Rhodothermaceae bacterium]
MSESYLVLLLGVLIGGFGVTVAWLVYALRRKHAGGSQENERTDKEAWIAAINDEKNQGKDDADAPPEEKFRFDQVYTLAEKLEDFVKRTAHPKDLLDRTEFQQGVELLKESSLAASELVAYGTGGNVCIACMALEALSQRNDDDDPTALILESLEAMRLWPMYFAMKALKPAPERSLIGAVLCRIDAYWSDNLFMQSML